MNRLRSLQYFVFVTILLIVFSSCGGNGSDEAAEVNARVEASLTAEAMETAVAATLEAAEATYEAIPTHTASPTISPEPLPTITLTPTVAHVMIPDEPQGAQSSLTDISTAPFAEEGTSIGDSYVINLYERPFTAEQMNYRGYLDITFTSLMVDSNWVYVIIHLEEDLPEGAAANYGIEIDLDIDGRGDWLVLAALPPTSDWTTDGVGVYKDTDGDVGATIPLRSDAPVHAQNGYEKEVFLGGQGADPDTAWTRRDPEAANRIQIAFKLSLLGKNQGFLWGIWANEGNENPAWFDYNDHFTLEEAGSPVKENHAYPLKALALLDSTCRSWFGFEPVGNEPGICGMTMTTTEEEPGPNSGWCIQSLQLFVLGGCASPCYEQCPSGSICIPCILP